MLNKVLDQFEFPKRKFVIPFSVLLLDERLKSILFVVLTFIKTYIWEGTEGSKQKVVLLFFLFALHLIGRSKQGFGVS